MYITNNDQSGTDDYSEHETLESAKRHLANALGFWTGYYPAEVREQYGRSADEVLTWTNPGSITVNGEAWSITYVDDGDSGQDHESYSDDQDHDSYEVTNDER